MSTSGLQKSFPELVVASELINPDRWSAFLRNLPEPHPVSPKEWADRLIAAKLLTPFQCKLLLQGRYRDFVLKGKYRIRDLLGAGGMGKVFLCEHIQLNRLVAVKVLTRERLAEADTLERFYREAQLAATLNHPNIVRVYDLEPDPKMPMIIMEYIDGIDLQSLVGRGSPLEPLRAAQYIAQAALGLQHAAQFGMVHRDIKPANLLLDRQGVVKILDLGLARFHGHAGSVTQKFDDQSIFGTADYLAPEQAMNLSLDIRADIYALGGTFYFLLTGEPPFNDGSIAQKLMAHQMKPVPALSTKRNDVPSALEAVMRRMLAKSPDQRYAQPIDVVAALQSFDLEPGVAPKSGELGQVRQQGVPTTTSQTTDLSTRLPVKRLFVLPIVCGLLIAGVGIWAMTRSSAPTAETKIEEEVLSPEQAMQHVGKVKTIRFRVERAGYNPKQTILFLNSMANFSDPKCFTVVIDEALGKRMMAGIGFRDLGKQFERKTVQVRGPIIEYQNRAEIVLKSVEQLSFVE